MSRKIEDANQGTKLSECYQKLTAQEDFTWGEHLMNIPKK